MASASLEEQSVSTFIKRLHALKDDEKQTVYSSISNPIQRPFRYKAPLRLPPLQQAAINDAVNETLGTKTTLQFTTNPELISGIELTTNGYKLAWSFADYLDALQKNIAATTKKNPSAKPEMNGQPVNA